MDFKYDQKGITLIELLVVILIVGILAAIAVPVYTQYMVRARRSDAKVALEQVRAAQEMWRAERGSYAINDGNGTAVAKLTNTMGVQASPIGGPFGDYVWDFTVRTATAFTALATPNSTRQTPDGWLDIDQNGTKRSQQPTKPIYTYPDPRSSWSK
jgi:type IV pilus assembly protein PilE